MVGIASACSGSDDEVVKPQPVLDVGDGGVGTCLAFDVTTSASVTELPKVDNCTVEHSHEIFAVVDSTAEVYPGFEQLEEEAQASCITGFQEYVGISPFDSELFYSWLVPTLDTWENDNDREIICVAGSADGRPLTESIKGTER
ncbi:MAG: hypothetical protein ACI9N0_001949 [Ilumatobacter sp.]